MTRLLRAVVDSGPVVVLAGIAAAGSFTHIRDTAAEHGQGGWMAWAIAVCVDLTCVMAAQERQRDRRTGRRRRGWVSWPTTDLAGGVLLSLAANLARADPTVFGWVSAGTPAGAFLVAVSMLERRASVPKTAICPEPSSLPSVAVLPVPVPTGRKSKDDPARPGSTSSPLSAEPSEAARNGAPGRALLDFAHRVAAEHQAKHDRPITRDALRARLGVSNALASDLLRQLRTE